MSKNIFDTGTPIELLQMLDAREQRVNMQQELLQQYPNESLLSATMNIPGPIKNNERLATAFLEVIQAVNEKFAATYLFQTTKNLETGMEFYLVTSLSPREFKLALIQIEETHPLGRLCDLDVLYLDEDKLQSVHRADCGLPPRKCYICENSAKECGRSRKHSIEEMQQKINQLIEMEEI
ncbi:MAG: citrate lyase holo-[acyl-carrier protein] synthase [Lactobacillales bacterium]|jgi:holo-ACP synthase|nr:citrate lyase holo-[acyl-carrier protein] synthase [Lactobacillales bacterium]